jgi:hypothetical protein
VKVKKKKILLVNVKIVFLVDLSKEISIQHLKSFVLKGFKKNGM